MNKKLQCLIHLHVLAAAIFVAAAPASASRSERKAQALTDSAKPIMVRGGEKLNVPLGYDATFEAVVQALKKADFPVALADRDAGLIATEIEITGSWRQTGSRTVVSLMKETDRMTIVTVAVTQQSRFKALQVEPWSEPKLNAPKTAEAAATIKAHLPSPAPAP
jgi:hypothetical protein